MGVGRVGGWGGDRQRNRQVKSHAFVKLPFSKLPFSFSAIFLRLISCKGLIYHLTWPLAVGLSEPLPAMICSRSLQVVHAVRVHAKRRLEIFLR